MSCLKLPSSIYENEKVQSLDPSVLKTWITILAVRAGSRSFPSVERIATITKQDPEEIKSHIALLIQRGLFIIDAKGKVRPLAI